MHWTIAAQLKTAAPVIPLENANGAAAFDV
jgi:hypothetical protein